MVHIVVTMRANRLDIIRLHTILLWLVSPFIVRYNPQPTTVHPVRA